MPVPDVYPRCLPQRMSRRLPPVVVIGGQVGGGGKISITLLSESPVFSGYPIKAFGYDRAGIRIRQGGHSGLLTSDFESNDSARHSRM